MDNDKITLNPDNAIHVGDLEGLTNRRSIAVRRLVTLLEDLGADIDLLTVTVDPHTDDVLIHLPDVLDDWS
jgi:hypothetical protein